MKSQEYRHVGQMNDSHTQSKFDDAWHDGQEPPRQELGF